MPPSIAAEAWLYQTLSSDGVINGWAEGIYVDTVPAPAPARYIYITQLDATDVSYVGAHIGWSNLVYVVRAVSEVGSYLSLGQPAERLHELIHRQRGETDHGKVIACYRTQPFRMVERSEDRTFRHLGGIYRLQVKE